MIPRLRALLALLRERWAWWLLPILVLLALTFVLSALGGGTVVAPFDYGLAP